MKTLAWIFTLLLAFSMVAIADDDEETVEERLDRLEENDREQDLEIEDADVRIGNLETELEISTEPDPDATTIIEKAAKAGNKIANAVIDIGSAVVEVFVPSCRGYCKLLGYEPEEHKRTCKRGHDWWTCAPGAYGWLHAHCCPRGLVWTDEFGCVEPGYSPPPKPWYGSSGSNSQSDN